MKKSNLYLFIIVFISLAVLVNAQDKDGDVGSYVDWAWQGEFRPYFEFSYGYTQPMHDLFESEFAPIGSFEAKIGYSDISLFKSFVLGMDERYLFGSVLSPDYNYIDNEPPGVTSEGGRFGFGNRLGFGYDIGPIELLPYNQIQYVWTKFNPVDSTGISLEDGKILDRYAGAFRFGHSGEAGVKLQIAQSLAVTVGYEFAVVYPPSVAESGISAVDFAVRLGSQ
jgi:hypothetical protein